MILLTTVPMLVPMLLGVLLVLTAVGGAPPPARSCAGELDDQRNLFGPGTEPYSVLKTLSKKDTILECCEACTANASGCGAYFAKLGEGAGAGGGAGGGECKLYSFAEAAKLQSGGCPAPAGKNVICGSMNFAGPPPPPPLPPPPPPPGPRPETVELTVASEASWIVSPWLASMSLVYVWAPDAVYNGTMAKWAISHRLNTARFPAGMASYWDWEHPSGYMGNSTLSKDWVGPPAPSAQWMSLSEYLVLCKAAGLTPLVGVNYNCHNYQKCTETAEDSIARAVRQVQFVVKAGFPGAFWYIGNEDSAPKYPALIARHAMAMKAVDPTLKCFWNDNNVGPDSLKAFLAATGPGVMDGVEFHGKWPYGGSPHWLEPFSYAQWLAEVPLLEHKSKQSWRAKIDGLRQAAAEVNRSELLFANNEYGLGKTTDFRVVAAGQPGANFTRFSKSMVAIELALEIYSSGYDMACFWDNGDGGLTGGDWGGSEHMLLDTNASFRMNPMHYGLEMLARAQRKSLLKINGTAAGYRVHGFATRNETAPGAGAGPDAVFLINKFEVEQNVNIKLGSPTAELGHVISLVDTEDHWGALVGSRSQCTAGVCELMLPPVSFSMITQN